jgi:hypothetical protein
MSRLDSNDPKDMAWRYEQALIDADIAGMKRHPALEEFVAQMDADGIDAEEQIKRIIAFDLDAAKDSAS